MGIQVQFSYPAFVARYPEFASVSLAQAQEFFNEATIYHANDGGGPVSNATIQSALLNMVTAHISALYTQSQGDPSPGSAKDANSPVGRISNASEGSVSAAFDYGSSASDHKMFFCQTKYGASYWAATQQYRTARYLSGVTPCFGVPGFGAQDWN
jgi:hypothetical protein